MDSCTEEKMNVMVELLDKLNQRVDQLESLQRSETALLMSQQKIIDEMLERIKNVCN